jgi:acyl dehydratase
MPLTGPGNYYEDFQVGDVLWHARGRTVGDSEHMAWTCRVMNTAQLHFNQALCDEDPNLQAQYQGRRPVFGVYVTAVCMGLAAQDTTENALAVTALLEASHRAGVFAGDTLFAKSEVLEKRDAGRPDAGIVRFKLTGYTQDRKTVCVEATYEALIRRRPR